MFNLFKKIANEGLTNIKKFAIQIKLLLLLLLLSDKPSFNCRNFVISNLNAMKTININSNYT